MSRKFALVLSCGLAVVCGAGSTAMTAEPPAEVPTIPIEVVDQMTKLPGDLGVLPPVKAPADNPTTPEKIELGRKLFFEKGMSKDYSTSCATCHAPEFGFADGKPLATGFGGKTLGRHTPTVLSAAHNGPQFWDGRADGLEAQAVGPIMAAGEMNMGTEELVVDRLKGDKYYAQAFKTIFNAEPSLKLVGKAIAAYERTLAAGDSPFDRYAAGDKSALSDQQKRGLLLFFGKASCTQCHSGPNFTDNQFYNLGIKDTSATPDVGRFAVSKVETDRAAFKTPTVRNAELTAPFMHNGSEATIEQLIEFYNQGGGPGVQKSNKLTPLNLSEPERADLAAFIRSLTSDSARRLATTATASGKDE